MTRRAALRSRATDGLVSKRCGSSSGLLRTAFTATWPNLIVEPDSEKAKTDDIVTKAVLSFVEVMAPQLDPENKARLLCWAADQFNGRKTFEAIPLELDEEAISAYEPPVPMTETKPEPESSHL